MTDRDVPDTNRPLWSPSPERIAATNMTGFMRYVQQESGIAAQDYAALYDWSVRDLEGFWRAVWSYCRIIAAAQGSVVVANRNRMPGAQWFPGAQLNFAETHRKFHAPKKADPSKVELPPYYPEHPVVRLDP